MTRIFFATDIHGSTRCFKKFLNAFVVYKCDVLILGGDITGKVLAPVVEHGSDQVYTVKIFGKEESVRKGNQLDSILKILEDAGQYPYICSQKEFEDLKNEELLSKVFLRCQIDRIKKWLDIVETKFHGTSAKIFVTGGNDDPLEIEEILKPSTVVIDREGEVTSVDTYHELISCGYGNPTPWKTPRDKQEYELADIIQKMAEKLKDPHNSIFNLHVPPLASGLDVVATVDWRSQEYITHGGTPRLTPAGSLAVREAIVIWEPLLSLHGHIHESKGIQKIGRTLCINPGSEYGEGILRGALVVLDKDKIKEYALTSG